MKLEERLKKMVNKSWMHNAVIHKLLSFSISESAVILVTDKKWFHIPPVKINSELESFLPVDDEKPQEVTVFQQTNRDSLKDVLLSNIKNLQNSPTFLSQAREINSQVKTLLQMAKLEIDVIKLREKK